MPALRKEVRVAVDGHRKLHCAIYGNHTGPVVILDKGASGGGVWGSVLEEIAKFATVVTYDRAGVGMSDPPTQVPTADHISDDLHRLIDQAEIRRPVILVVWSLTGLSGLLHAKRYPQDLDAVVFIDPTPFDLYDDPKNAGMLRRPKMTVVLQKVMSGLGYGRRWGRAQMVKFIRDSCGPGIDERFFDEYIESLFRISSEKATGELYWMRESCEMTKSEVSGARFQDIRAIILSAEVDTSLSEKSAAAKHRNHRAYAKLFTQGQYLPVARGSHMMTLDRPDIIVAAVQHLWNGGTIPFVGRDTAHDYA